MSTSKHGCSFEIIRRDQNGRGSRWLASCACKTRWDGATYQEVEDEWRQHVHGITGKAPSPTGGDEGRWMP
jgi:hypothetical protein